MPLGRRTSSGSVTFLSYVQSVLQSVLLGIRDLAAPPQTQLPIDTHTMVTGTPVIIADIHRNVLQEGAPGQNPPASATSYSPTTEFLPSPRFKPSQRY